MPQNTLGDLALEYHENIGVDIVKIDKQYILSALLRGKSVRCFVPSLGCARNCRFSSSTTISIPAARTVSIRIPGEGVGGAGPDPAE